MRNKLMKRIFIPITCLAALIVIQAEAKKTTAGNKLTNILLVTVNAGPDYHVCQTATSFPALNGSIGGTATSATWSGGTGTFSPNNTTLNAVYIPSAAELANPGVAITLTLTTDDPPGPDIAASDQVTVTVDEASIVNAGPDQTICATDTIFLHATLSGVATNMVWQKNVAFGVFIGSDTNPDAVFVLNENGMNQTSIKFGAMSNDPGANVCQGGLDTVEIFIHPRAIVTARNDTTVCASTSFIQLSGSFGGQATTASWSGGTGSFVPNANTINAQYVFTAADTTARIVKLYLTTDNPPGLCGPAKDSVTITIDPASIINAGPDQTICATDTIFLHATLSGQATNMVWQKNVAFGNFIGSDTNPDAVFVLNENGRSQSSIRFGAMSNDPGANVCQGGLDTVEIFISPAATVAARNDTTICASTPLLQLSGTLGGAATAANWSGGTGAFLPNAQTLNAQYVFTAADTAARTVKLFLTSNDPPGQCGPGKDSVIITIDPASIINAGPDQVVCAKDTLYFNATLSGMATNMVWQKNLAFGNFVGPDTDPNAKYLLNAAGQQLSSLSFGAMSNDPGGNVCQGGLDTVVFFINPVPPVIATPTTQTICSGSSLTPIQFSGGGAGTTYSWTRDNIAAVTGLPGSGTGNISGALVNTTSLPVTVTFTVTSGSVPCSGTVTTVTVVVNPPINLVCPGNITVSNTTGQCGAAVSFPTSVTGIPAPTLSFTLSGSTTGSGSGSGTGTFFNVGITTVTITAANNSCAPAVCSFTVRVNDVQAPAITCPAAITLSCAAAVPAPNTALVVATDNCPAVLVTHVSDVISNQTCTNRFTVTRTYRATDAAGNFTNCTQVITVNDQTAPVITCPANITATTPFGSCVAIVNFTPTATDNCGGPVTIVSVPASGSAFPIGNTTVTSTATDACGNSAVCTFTVTVLDGQLPVITSQPANRTVCEGSNATFSVTAITSPNANGPIGYQWQQWNGTAWVNINGATATSFTVNNVTTAMNTNTFRVVLTGLCSVVNSAAVTLFVNPLPAISISATVATSLQPGQTTNIAATATPSGGNYAWQLNGSPLNTVTGPTIGPLSVDHIGSYTVIYTDPNGCVRTSNTIVLSGLASENLWVYPNPNTGQFQLRFFNQANEPATILVYNSLGRLVQQKAIVTGLPYSRADIDLGTTAPGIYVVKLIGTGGRQLAAKKIIVR